MKKEIILSIVVALLVSGVICCSQRYFGSQGQRGLENPVWTEGLQLEYANILLSKGLNHQAAAVLEGYLDKARAAKKELAGVAYKLGNTYMDLGEYEKALGSFYKSEIFESNAEYKQELGQRVVEALEKLGLSKQAKYELENRTSLNPPSKLPENIIARIGKREIAQSEIDTAIENVPQWMRGALATDEGKLKFIRQYVAGEILYDKAKRLGFDRNPRIIEAVNDYKKNVTVQALMQKEVEQSLKIDADDLVLYYKANKEKYVVPEKIKVSYLESGDKDKKEDIVASLKAGKGRKSDQWIEKNFTFIPDIGEVKDVVSGLFKLDKGSCSEPTKINDKTYIFLIEDKQPEKQLSFEEVKSQVEGEYKNKKQQEIISSLVDKSLEQQEVEILFKPNKENGNQKK